MRQTYQASDQLHGLLVVRPSIQLCSYLKLHQIVHPGRFPIIVCYLLGPVWWYWPTLHLHRCWSPTFFSWSPPLSSKGPLLSRWGPPLSIYITPMPSKGSCMSSQGPLLSSWGPPLSIYITPMTSNFTRALSIRVSITVPWWVTHGRSSRNCPMAIRPQITDRVKNRGPPIMRMVAYTGWSWYLRNHHSMACTCHRLHSMACTCHRLHIKTRSVQKWWPRTTMPGLTCSRCSVCNSSGWYNWWSYPWSWCLCNHDSSQSSPSSTGSWHCRSCAGSGLLSRANHRGGLNWRDLKSHCGGHWCLGLRDLYPTKHFSVLHVTIVPSEQDSCVRLHWVHMLGLRVEGTQGRKHWWSAIHCSHSPVFTSCIFHIVHTGQNLTWLSLQLLQFLSQGVSPPTQTVQFLLTWQSSQSKYILLSRSIYSGMWHNTLQNVADNPMLRTY